MSALERYLLRKELTINIFSKNTLHKDVHSLTNRISTKGVINDRTVVSHYLSAQPISIRRVMLHIGFVSLLILITFYSVKCPLAPLAAIIQTCNCLLHRYINKPFYKSLYESEIRSKKFPFSFVKL